MFNSIVSSVKRKTEKSNKKVKSSFCLHCKIFSLLIGYVCGRVLFDFILYTLFVWKMDFVFKMALIILTMSGEIRVWRRFFFFFGLQTLVE